MAPADLALKLALVKGREEERARLAKELHDGIGPLLTTLKLQVGAIEMRLEEKEKLKALIDNTIDEIRRISNNLTPSVLQDFGVGEALRNLISAVRSSVPHLTIRYQSDISHSDRIPHDVQVALYRIAQEGLNNAIRHAQAREIKLSITQFDDRISLFLIDDGRGFNLNQAFEGKGLYNMRFRTDLLRGSFLIASGDDGTAVEVEIPITTR